MLAAAAAPPMTESRGQAYNTIHVCEDFLLPPQTRPSSAARHTIDCSKLPLDDIDEYSDVVGSSPFKTPVAVPPTVAFTVSDLLTTAECQRLIDVATPHMRSTNEHFSQRDRVSSRAMIASEQVADELFRRLMPHVRLEDYAGRIPLCFGHGGTWVPCRLNTCLKVVLYAQQRGPHSRPGHFAQHRDGPWIPREDEASMLTMLLYLNDVSAEPPAGRSSFHRTAQPGATALLGSRSTAPLGQQRDGYNGRSPQIQPVAGTALLFNHDCWHRGNATAHDKYVLRTELIFRRSHAAYVDRLLPYEQTEAYRATRALYQRSMDAMASGDTERFFDVYQDVIQRQRDAMLDTLNVIGPHRAALLGLVGSDVLSVILEFAGLGAAACLMRVNVATYYGVVQLPLWFTLTCQQYPDAAATKPSQWLRRALAAPAANNVAFPFVPLDWMVVYSQLRLMACSFAPAVLSMVCAVHPLLSFKTTFAIPLHHNLGRRGLEDTPVTYTQDNDPGRTFFQVPSCYSRWEWGYPMHMNQPLGEEYQLHDDPVRVGSTRGSVERSSVAVDWSILAIPLEVAVDPTAMSFAIVGCPHWFTHADHGDARGVIEAGFLAQTQAPAVAILHPAVVAVVAWLVDTGAGDLRYCSPEAQLLEAAAATCRLQRIDSEADGHDEGYYHVLFVSKYALHACAVKKITLVPDLIVDVCNNPEGSGLKEAFVAVAAKRSFDIVVTCSHKNHRHSDSKADGDHHTCSECSDSFSLLNGAALLNQTHLCRAAARLAALPQFRQLCTFRL